MSSYELLSLPLYLYVYISLFFIGKQILLGKACICFFCLSYIGKLMGRQVSLVWSWRRKTLLWNHDNFTISSLYFFLDEENNYEEREKNNKTIRHSYNLFQ